MDLARGAKSKAFKLGIGAFAKGYALSLTKFFEDWAAPSTGEASDLSSTRGFFDSH